MAVTRSSASERKPQASLTPRKLVRRDFEILWLLGSSVVVLAALVLVFLAKAPVDDPKLINLARVERSEQLLPALGVFSSPAERQFAARKIYDHIQNAGGKLPNIGSLGRIRVTQQEIRSGRFESMRTRLPQASTPDTTIPLFTPDQLAGLKRSAAVRTPDEFRTRLILWACAYFLCFYAVHFFWRARAFDGEQAFLPAIHLLTGIGFTLMISLRDPLRDTLAFSNFAQGVLLGAVVLAAASTIDYGLLFGRYSYLPLLGAFGLSTALILFGTGPGTSDAKVNLFGFQPVEAIKILLVFFLAGYFASRWEFLRVLKEKRQELKSVSRWLDLPRLEYVAPVLLAMALALVFFFLQKDLGPALVISGLFLALYTVARNRVFLAAMGLLLLSLGFLSGYVLGHPRTVRDRVDMWISPWDNMVRGGEQVVHALWAMGTGAVFGTGAGLGDPDLMPAAHTDLILAVVGEEFGFVGFVAIYAIYGILIWLGLRIAMRSRSDYGFFLALGMTLLLSFSILLISGGVLDLLPLSGVVTPFLSYGGTAMIANFLIAGILASLSRTAIDSEQTTPFRAPVRRVSLALAAAGVLIIGKAAWLQIARADVVVGAGTLTIQADGARRFQYNPRLMAIARSIPRGSIYDATGLPLATSDWQEIEKHRADFDKIGVVLERSVNERDSRHYPLGAPAVHVLGDLRSRANWGARNSSLVERDSMVRLQGYDDRARVVEVEDPRRTGKVYAVRHDFRELVPLLRRRYQPDHPDVLKVMNRERDVRLSIHAGLQVRASRLLQAHLQKLQKKKGAAVVMNASTGAVLAVVNYPWPEQMPPRLGPDDGIDEMLDRARYGLYPPGSTFKLVTAIAALRKDPNLARQTYECKRLPDGRVGNFVRGWGRPIRDDVADKNAHGLVDMNRGTVVSCNAYYAQLGTYSVGPEALHQTAHLFGIAVARPDTPAKLRDALPQAAYGQGQVVASPFQMARVAATIAAGGVMPYGHWINDETNPRAQGPQRILPQPEAAALAAYMRAVVTQGTGRSLAARQPAISGKTGTAEIEKHPSHAWFAGFSGDIAFAVIVENGQYGGSAAAPIAGDIVTAAHELGVTQNR